MIVNLLGASKLPKSNVTPSLQFKNKIRNKNKIFPPVRKITYFPEALKKIKNLPFLEKYIKKKTILIFLNSLRTWSIFYTIGHNFPSFLFFYSSIFSLTESFWLIIGIFCYLFLLATFFLPTYFYRNKINKLRIFSGSFILFQYFEKLAIINGNFKFLFFFGFLLKFAILFLFWFSRKKNFQLNKKNVLELILVRNFKKLLSGFILFEITSKSSIIFFTSISILRLACFPFFNKNWDLFSLSRFKKSYFISSSHLNAFIFGIFIIYILFLLYYVAFKKIENIVRLNKNDFVTVFYKNKQDLNLFKRKISGFTYYPNPIFLKNNNKQTNKLVDLLYEENSDQQSNNSLWKIKKKGVNVPFGKILWNNEITFLKQGLWYEIRKKK